MTIYFGDLHTHTNLSDGICDPDIVIARAKSTLDFFAFTDHAQLPDTISWGPDVFPGWRFVVQPLGERWGSVQELIRSNHEPGKFVPFLAYEWSSRQWGDHNVYYLNDDEPIRYARSLAELYASLKDVKAMVFPHHTAYPRHHRGYDWSAFDTSLAPVVEVMSHHGSSETHRGGLMQFNGPGMGPCCQSGTIQRMLDKGYIAGIVASSDDHQGWPGSHAMGLMGAHAEELTREAIWDAIWKRRVYGVSGDRIWLDFSLNGNPMGSVVEQNRATPREIAVDVNCWDLIKTVEAISNGEVVETWSNFEAVAARDDGRYKIHLEWGYHGGKEREWDIEVKVVGGTIEGHNLHFGRPGDDRCVSDGSGGLSIKSTTAGYTGTQGNNSRVYGGVKGIDFEVNGQWETQVVVRLNGRIVLQNTLARIMEESRCAMPNGPYQGAIHLVRCVPEAHYKRRLEWTDERMPAEAQRYYYIRVTQLNGQHAWSSPIWVRQVGAT